MMDDRIKKILDDEHCIYSTVSFGGGWAGGEPAHTVFAVFAYDSRRTLFDSSDMRLGSETKYKDLWTSKMRELDNEAIDHLEDAQKILNLNSCRVDPKGLALAADERAKLTALFPVAGLSPIFIEDVPNEYGPAGSEETINQPWLMVTAPIGHIKIGWRRSVINIDWSRSLVQESGETLFPAESTTKGGSHDRDSSRFIHAHGYEKAAEYLKVLALAVKVKP
jgi:hypothetical protein